ncbi:MAG: endonuclease III domain-containing protein [Terriglobales bacterium]
MGPPGEYHRLLSRHFGPQHWWPARSRWEIMVGAVLTQNTAWRNVELAIAELRRRNWLTPPAILAVRPQELGAAIRSAGFYRQKARCLQALAAWVERRHGGRLSRLFRQPMAVLRAELLALPGIGPETADSILLYAGGHASFVVDAYTLRLLDRHGEPIAAGPGDRYERVSAWFAAGLGYEVARLQEMHALIVAAGKAYCRKTTPRCGACPLGPMLPEAGAAALCAGPAMAPAR